MVVQSRTAFSPPTHGLSRTLTQVATAVRGSTDLDDLLSSYERRQETQRRYSNHFLLLKSRRRSPRMTSLDPTHLPFLGRSSDPKHGEAVHTSVPARHTVSARPHNREEEETPSIDEDTHSARKRQQKQSARARGRVPIPPLPGAPLHLLIFRVEL